MKLQVISRREAIIRLLVSMPPASRRALTSDLLNSFQMGTDLG
jgi:hypothetical protein